MIWVDREAKRLKQRNLPLEWVDDMKTPSGRIHVGSLRGVIVHDLVYKALKDIGVNAKISYVFNDMDQMDGMPSYLDKNKWEKYMGFPLYKIPSPAPGFKSFAEYYAKEFIDVFNSINCHPQIIWSSKLHQSGKMNEVIKLILDKTDIVRDIFKRVIKKEKPANWYPYNPICKKCGKIGTTNVYKWDGKYVYYRCEKKMVEWAAGCGYDGKIEPINENGKLVWRLDWPAHWKVIGITVESSGKDHMSSGGSYDMADHFCREILGTQAPDAMGGYEWFTIGGRKMSSSKGIGSSAKEVSEILPPDVFRFMQVRTPIKTHLDFDPYGDTIPNLFDDYDKLMESYFLKIENNLPIGKAGEVASDFARIIELSAVSPLPLKRIFLPRFRTIVNLIKTKRDIESFFVNQKGSELTIVEKSLLEERIKYAKLFIEKYSVEKTIPQAESTFTLSPEQKNFLKILLTKLKIKNVDPQVAIFESIKEAKIQPRLAFSAFYFSLTGKQYGPKAGDLINTLGITKVVELLSIDEKENEEKVTHLFPTLNNPEIFSINKSFVEKYPSVNIGIAVIKNIKIKKSDPKLKEEIDNFILSQKDLTNEIISSYPELLAYRKLYKEMGLDWHSKRPSPEALLRRIALGKGLYEINTCVDAYNLIVMKNRVSIGAFDYDKLKFPTVLRFPKDGEEILLLGDNEPTKYKPTDVAYFDQVGGYNIYFNYRDAQRTAVTEDTKDIILNIDGIYDISRSQVERSLKESIEIITKYCGGKVELAGIVSVSK
ncbi:MAG: Lysine-tRNA ligase [Candidatus Roizmanbacteria bacterium GW2011_GWA2_35_19]|uniref:Lysine--tRNA ligase n=2 Tax=Candidatus Roizmaniibacteriota TaxID=1752723 RepID=A0A0G0BYY8_9BACT|nr:MAG: Lysine-tRNA ligase [Candidatus Roizmanbacteria bacterium GW2011_GWC2_35_12]KKP74433.1 MAG: Lysine-tRNA ligase [Candidatus Roizmanbacteria bacterium GW2011_GWA2_35_19]